MGGRLAATGIESLELADDLVLHIFAGKVPSYEGERAYERARAAHRAGHDEQAFLGRWLALSDEMLERYGKAERGRFVQDKL